VAGTAPHPVLNLKSLREQVYERLRRAINRGELDPGAFIDQNRISAELGISRQPLRDALIQLEAEGFVSILPRRGVVVKRLGLDDIRHLYETVGALEGAALLSVHAQMNGDDFERMRVFNREMLTAIDDDDFDTYYDFNLRLHDVFLERSDNHGLVRTVNMQKQRLYDFPRAAGFVAEWERASIGEHTRLVELLEAGDGRGAADFLRDVHWCFEVQRPYILQYYFPGGDQAGQ